MTDNMYLVFSQRPEAIADEEYHRWYATHAQENVESTVGKAVGPTEIEALLVRTLDVYPSDRERTHHLVMNPVIEVDGDTATSRSNWGYVTRSDTDAPVFEMLGHYVDELVRTPDGWRFQRREAYSDVPYISLEGII